MKPIIFEQVIRPNDVESEDSGACQTADVGTQAPGNLYVRLISYDESRQTKPFSHPEMDQLVGKRVRVTLEIVE